MLNPDEFLNNQVEGAMDTVVEACPEGEWNAIIQDVKFRDFTYKKGDRQGETGYAMDIIWQVVDDEVKNQLSREPIVRQSCMLDVTASGGLDMGKGRNIGLGRLRDALGQNDASRPWSPSLLKGQMAVVLVTHRIDGDNIYADVNKVRAA